jgi:haloacetate dehalogenase
MRLAIKSERLCSCSGVPKGTVGELWNVLATWRPKTQSTLEGQALPCGHLIPEEQPEGVISQFRRFFERNG